MRRSSIGALLAALVIGATALPAAVAATGEPADAVLDWNVNATSAIVAVARQPPHAAILSFAMVQGAVYDAVNAIDGDHDPYLVSPEAEPTDSKAAATAAAARRVLVSLFPPRPPGP